ncbi:2Fe-2S iron-sulfur cluster-binding protein [Chloroflexota bacterium]
MKTISLTIDGKKITASEGENLLWVALDNGIYIPNLCALRGKLEPAAACRLCFVELEGKEQPVTACTETVVDGLVVNTRGTKALRLARTAFELLMASHPVDCACCPANRSCELQIIARHLGAKLKSKRFRKLLRGLPIDDSNPIFIYDPNKCVLCGRCVWVCRQQGIGAFGFAHRGFERIITTFGDEPMSEAKCQDCEECIAVCPTGALVFKDEERRKSKLRKVKESY